jgi:hypothetical protein
MPSTISKEARAAKKIRDALKAQVIAAFAGENEDLAGMITNAGYMDPRDGIRKADLVNSKIIARTDIAVWEKEGLESVMVGRGKYFPVIPLLRFAFDRTVRRKNPQTEKIRGYAEKDAEFKAKERELKFNIQAGAYIEVEEVKRTWCEHINAVRKRLLAIPRAMATRLQGETRRATIEKLLKEEVHSALEEMSQ